MKSKDIIILVILLLILGGSIFALTRKKDSSDTKNSNSNLNSNSNIISNSNEPIDSNNNPIISNSNSNISSNSNSNKTSNITSNNTSNKTSNTPKPVSYLSTNNSFSGIFENDNDLIHMFQNGNDLHFTIINKTTKSQVTAHASVNQKVASTSHYKITFNLLDKGVKLSISGHNSISSGTLYKIGQFTKNNYFEEFLHGNIAYLSKQYNGVFQKGNNIIKI